jgi:hypothetical protein
MELEAEYGVPVVMLHTHVFERVVRGVVRMNGMPRMRAAFVPQPVMGKTTEQLWAYVNGLDPITKQPVMDEVVQGLTGPLTIQDVQGESFTRSTPRLVDPDNEDNLRRLFEENNWTDFLPIVLPTEERVAAMLAGTSHQPDEVVGRMRPTAHREAWEYTVEKVAVNAVMAGARPEYFPVILALAASGITARGSTSSSAAAMAVVNGPIRHELRMNWGTGAMGPHNHANATIGRAYSLLSQNLQGGSVAGSTYMGSQGNGYSFTNVTFAENEERSPWEPLHVTHGLQRDASAVTVFGGLRTTHFILGLREGHWREHMRNLLRGMDPITPPVLVLDPIAADQFVVRGGFDSKQKLVQWIHENALMPAAEYWDLQLVQNYVYPRATAGEEPYATKLKAAPDELIPMFRPEQVEVVVVGGETNAYFRIMGASYGKTVSVDAWR